MEINVKKTVRAVGRAAARGVTLVEVLIVVSIMAVISGGAVVLAFPLYKEARIKTAIVSAKEIKKAAQLYQEMDATAEGCPTIQDCRRQAPRPDHGQRSLGQALPHRLRRGRHPRALVRQRSQGRHARRHLRRLSRRRREEGQGALVERRRTQRRGSSTCCTRRRSERRRGCRGGSPSSSAICVALIAVVTGLAMMGGSVADGARLKHSAVMIAGAVRIAYGHANATSKVVRLVFDIDARTVSIEEASSDLSSRATTSPAAPRRRPKPRRRPRRSRTRSSRARARRGRCSRRSRRRGGIPDKDKSGRELEKNIRSSRSRPVTPICREDRPRLPLLLAWRPDRARGDPDHDQEQHIDADALTILISPLTGKTDLRRGRLTMPRPRDDVDASERQDTGF